MGGALCGAAGPPATVREARRRDEEEAYFVGRLNSAATAMESPRRVVVVTPNDIEALMRDERGELPERGSVFACAEVFLQEGEVFIERPSLDDIFVTDVVEDVVGAPRPARRSSCATSAAAIAASRIDSRSVAGAVNAGRFCSSH